MTPVARPASPPRAVVGCWAISVAAGVFLVATPWSLDREPSALSPYSVAAYLTRVAPAGARDVRVNGLYGSGHGGAWQFVAHVTWRDSSGEIAGGTTNLPILAGGSALASAFDVERLKQEHTIGWSVEAIDSVLDTFDDVDASLALIEFEPTGHDAVITQCAATRSGTGSCQTLGRNARVLSRASAELTDDPLAGPLAVQRRRSAALASPW